MKIQKKNILAAFVTAVFTFCTVYFGWFSSVNLPLQDSIYQKMNTVDASIKVIAIDEKTLDSLGQFETWTREVYAKLINTLNQDAYRPKVIALDILMVNEKGSEDQLLVEACKDASNVVMASNLVFSTKIETRGGKASANTMHIEMTEMPFGELKEYVRTGFVNTVQDSRDNSVRYTLLKCGEYQSFASVIAEMAAEESAERTERTEDVNDTEDAEQTEVSLADFVPMDENHGIFIDYTGSPNTYETLSLIDVLEGRIPAAAFAGSIVLVGAHAAGMGDSYLVPSATGAQMYGVEIHANIVQGLLEQRVLTNVSPLLNGLCCAVLVFLMTVLFSKIKIWGSILLAAVLTAGEYFLCMKLDEQGLVINIIGLPLALLLSLIWSIVSKYAAEVLQRRKIMHAFQKYVAPQVVEEISRNHNYQLKLGGEKRHIAVLFVDIRGFTPMSEALQPEQVVEILNEYLGLVTDAIFKHGGTLDKFIGDAAMAVFNAPFDSEDYVYKAVCAAKDIAAGSERIAEKFIKRFGRTVSYGIGVNCGDAVVGNIGCDFRMDYTAIGDTVNTAARLESNAKPGQILISEFVYEKVKDRIRVTQVGEIPLKGKSKGVMVYQVDE